MKDKEFDELIRLAVNKRDREIVMPEDMPDRVMFRMSETRRNVLPPLLIKIAVSAVAMAAIVLTMFIPSEQESVPAFYTEAQVRTDLRIAQMSSVSQQVRKEINNQYESLQSCCGN